MFQNLDTCTRNIIHTLQTLEACTVDHREYPRASWVFHSLVRYCSDWLGVLQAGAMFPNLDTCTRNVIHALQALQAFTIGHQEFTNASGVFQ